MTLQVTVTSNDVLIDFGDFRIITPKDYLKGINNIYWHKDCIMFDTDEGLESIGLEHLLFGEPPFNKCCDYKIEGIDILTKDKLREYMKQIRKVRWYVDGTN